MRPYVIVSARARQARMPSIFLLASAILPAREGQACAALARNAAVGGINRYKIGPSTEARIVICIKVASMYVLNEINDYPEADADSSRK